MVKKNSSLILLLLISAFPLQAIQSSTANISTALVGVLSGAASYAIECEIPNKIPPAIFVSASCCITAVTYMLLHRSTPLGRIKRANILLNDLSRHTLARTCFHSDKAFYDAVQDVYLTDDLPLISAYNHLISLLPTSHYALSLINKASAEVYKDVLLQEECDASRSRANTLFKNISDAIKRIREHKDYLSQLALYKESLAQQQQTIAQQQMASAHQEIAQAKQSGWWLKLVGLIFGK
ncbi:MAG TPA: hypothetical protein VKU36_00500 [Candidatus Babeliales bacterium]|jgi:hypothetical protein|nr:hypothetical protein [Candidatus Babeliales bacterium]